MPGPLQLALPARCAPLLPRIAAAGLQLRRSGAAAACRRTPPHRCFGPGRVDSSSARVFGPWVGRHRGAVYSNRCGGPRGSAAAAARVNRAPASPRDAGGPRRAAAAVLESRRAPGGFNVRPARPAWPTCQGYAPSVFSRPSPRAAPPPPALRARSGPARPACLCAPHPPRLSVAATDKGGTARRTRRRRALLPRHGSAAPSLRHGGGSATPADPAAPLPWAGGFWPLLICTTCNIVAHIRHGAVFVAAAGAEAAVAGQRPGRVVAFELRDLRPLRGAAKHAAASSGPRPLSWTGREAAGRVAGRARARAGCWAGQRTGGRAAGLKRARAGGRAAGRARDREAKR